ncbi:MULTISPECIES: aspartyl-phosphate phosphatase Spo0E family protein [Paenibacillus]|nr:MULTISPECIES: aspartyl-phosphate phosphatase Spo0E family protein [Paenibacillus]GCL70728.1 Spo0E family sporulation regulatory protein-aspartic acid phosphatase [Paenibacillus naphthalenovorans]
MLVSSCPDKQSAITSEIEEVRGRMVSLGVQFGLLHPEVQRCSQQLDELLLRYHHIKLGPAAKAPSL